MAIEHDIVTCGQGVYIDGNPEKSSAVEEVADYLGLIVDGHHPAEGEVEKEYYHIIQILLEIKKDLKKKKKDIKDLEDRVTALEGE